MLSKIKKILVIRPDAIGDLVLTLPAIHALRQHFPDAHIAIIVKKYTSELAKIHPDINEVIIDENPNLKEKHFDLGIDFYSFDIRYPLMMLRAGIPYRVGDKSRIMLNPFYNQGTILPYKDYTKHMIELELLLLQKLGIKDNNPQFNLPAPSIDLTKFGLSANDFVIGIHPGCGSSKPWDSKGYAKVCDALQEKYKAKVVITGGAKERAKAAEIISLCQKKPINLVEKTSLLELMALIKRFNIYIGADTGPTHLAAALKTPLVMLILAKNVKPVRWAPWNSQHIVIYPHPVANCPLYCDPPKCQETYCSSKVSVNQILDAVEKLKNIETHSLEDWRRMSFNVLLIADKNDQANNIVSEMTNKGYNITLLSPEEIKSIKNLLKIIETKNILFIYHLDKRVRLSVRLANLLSGIYTTNATVLVSGYQRTLFKS